MTLVRRDLLSGFIGFCVAAAAARSSGHAEEAPASAFGRAATVLPGSGAGAGARSGGPSFRARWTAPCRRCSRNSTTISTARSIPPRRGAVARARFGCRGAVLSTSDTTSRPPVHIYEVADGMARQVLYTPQLFDFGQNGFKPDFPEDLGFAGFRLHAPLNRPDYLDELAVFLGASYFRALGRNQRYGISSRGVAIDTGLPKQEEFPSFRRFWLERPAPGADQIVVHALLDGPSLTGAFSFKIRPGDATVMDVEATLYPRQAIELLGIAPLTSMFLFGPNDRQGVDDFRPQVHDSEGLQIWSGSGEWFWRPLVNPQQLRLSLFSDKDPKGFGLMQRTRAFEEYEDLEARFGLRPSLWVEPLEGWGQGHVRLIEIPSPAEVNDNIVAFWVPRAPVEAGSEWRFKYRLYWSMEAPVRPELAQTAATRVGMGGSPPDGESRKFVIDFQGGQAQGPAGRCPGRGGGGDRERRAGPADHAQERRHGRLAGDPSTCTRRRAIPSSCAAPCAWATSR